MGWKGPWRLPSLHHAQLCCIQCWLPAAPSLSQEELSWHQLTGAVTPPQWPTDTEWESVLNAVPSIHPLCPFLIGRFGVNGTRPCLQAPAFPTQEADTHVL